MGSTNTRYVVNFGTQNLSSLIRARSVIRGIETQSYISFNSASRSLSTLERNSNRSSNQITRSMDRINASLRRLGMGGGRGGLGLLSMFSGLGAISFGVGALAGSVNLLHRAFVQTNTTMQSSRIMIEELLGSAGQADGFIGKMKDLSASFGQDLTETMSASRGLMQVMKQVNTPQPVHLEKMLKMVMAVNAMDLENRGLAYTAFSFKEAFQGMGRGDFRSLRNRLEVNLGKEMETAITNAIKKGDLDKAIELFDKGLQRIGINSDRLLKRLSSEGFLQNVNRLSSYFLRTFQVMGEPLFNALTMPFAKFNAYLAQAFGNGGAIKYLTSIGNEVRDSLNPFIQKIDQFFQMATSDVLKNPKNNIFTKFVDASRYSLMAFFSMMGLVKSFFMGALGLEDNTDVFGGIVSSLEKIDTIGKNLTKTFQDLKPAVHGAGQSFGNMAKEGFRAVGALLPTSGAGLGNAVYSTAKTAVDATSGTMGFMNNTMGAVGNIGSLLLAIATLRTLRNPVGTAMSIGGKAMSIGGKFKGLATPSSVAGATAGATVASNIGSNIIKGSGTQRFGVSPNFQVSTIPNSTQSQLQQEAYKLNQYTQIRSYEASKMPIGQAYNPTLNRQADTKFNKVSKTSWFQGGLSSAGNVIANVTNGAFMLMMMKDIFSGFKGAFVKHLPTISSGMSKMGFLFTPITTLMTNFLGYVTPIVTKLSFLVNPFSLAVTALIGTSLFLYNEYKKKKDAEQQEVEDTNTALKAQNQLTRYKKARSMIEGFAGGVSISELNRQMRVGLHGLPVNKGNYEYFLSHGADAKGRRAFEGVHSAFEAGLISPTDLKQASPQMYDIFSNKTTEMVHKGEITLKGLEKDSEFVKNITDQILRELAKKYPKEQPISPLDEATKMTETLTLSIGG